MRIDTIKKTILVLLVALSATGFSAVKKPYKSMTTEELQEEVKRQQLIREINKGCNDPSKIIGGAQARAQSLADREKARRDEWHKRNMEARERRLKSNVNIKKQTSSKPQQPNVVLGDFGIADTDDDSVSGSTDREREYNKGVRILSRLVSEASKREKSYSVTGGNYDPAKFAEAKRERKLWMKGFIGLEDLKREARGDGEEWAQY